MQKKQKIAVIGIFLIIFGIFMNIGIQLDSDKNYKSSIEKGIQLSAEQYREDLNSILNRKCIDYSTLGYFPQIYEPSLQATYYALFIYDALDKLDQINVNDILDYILSCYDSDSNIFYDSYAYRYLDVDPSQTYMGLKDYYPLTSLLEVNCYAILSLNILNRLEEIDVEGSIEFIWSCYNPISSGFIGQSYNSGLESFLKTSTMDNTYLAVLVLDILMDDWSDYSLQKAEIIQFVDNLQISVNTNWKYGGFYNDNDISFFSLEPFKEPSLLSSYSCIKTLQIFGVEDIINEISFNQFLDELYIEDEHYFVIYFSSSHSINIATALGLELSKLTGFSDLNESSTINFILNNRNPNGAWNSSNVYNMHELIDTFYVIRSLNNIGAISNLSANDKMEIVSVLSDYRQYQGFSLISKEYTSVHLINAIVSSFHLFDRIADLELQDLYLGLEECFRHYYYPEEWYGFLSYLYADPPYDGFRSFPIEYHNVGYHNYITIIDITMSFKSMFDALNAMEITFKLDEFESIHNLTKLINDIVNSQFLNNSFPDAYGAFYPNRYFIFNSYDQPEKKMFFEYSYYAIKSLELLVNYIGLGNLTDISFDRNALYSYIERNTIETSNTLYFAPWYTNDPTIILQNTYYMIYVLKAIDIYNLDDNKIENYVLDNLDYDNIKSIYYAFKISEILGLNLPFNVGIVVNLVESIYSEKNQEYYLSVDKQSIEQEIVLWISEMIKKQFFEQSTVIPNKLLNKNLDLAIPLTFIFIGIPGSVIAISTRQLNKSKRNNRNK
ncbi:MAG: hypothetical protein ACFE9T_06110 [Promethearchaeota archaeon]